MQQDRVIDTDGSSFAASSPLELEITNNGTTFHANNITVTGKTDCSNLAVNINDCASVAPGDTCTLELTSSTPYAPCEITVSGSNTSNSPTTLIAFFRVGGIVFEESGGSGKVVIDVVQGFNSPWTSTFSNIAGATSLDDGVANTDAIVADTACSGDTANCAAQRCRDIDADWYLPARNELSAVQSALCSNLAIPCNFGGFSSTFYYSSSQGGSNVAWGVRIPSGRVNVQAVKDDGHLVRCVRAFNP